MTQAEINKPASAVKQFFSTEHELAYCRDQDCRFSPLYIWINELPLFSDPAILTFWVHVAFFIFFQLLTLLQAAVELIPSSESSRMLTSGQVLRMMQSDTEAVPDLPEEPANLRYLVIHLLLAVLWNCLVLFASTIQACLRLKGDFPFWGPFLILFIYSFLWNKVYWLHE